jgi:hypothetical protein
MTLHRMVQASGIPYVKLGELVRFRASTIEDCLRKSEAGVTVQHSWPVRGLLTRGI